MLEGMNLAAGTVYGTDDLVAAVAQRRADEGAGDDTEVTAALKPDEYMALLNGDPRNPRTNSSCAFPPRAYPNSCRTWWTASWW